MADGFQSARDRAILLLLYELALAPEEVRGLCWRDVLSTGPGDGLPCQLHIDGARAAQQRTLELSETVVKALQDWKGLINRVVSDHARATTTAPTGTSACCRNRCVCQAMSSAVRERRFLSLRSSTGRNRHSRRVAPAVSSTSQPFPASRRSRSQSGSRAPMTASQAAMSELEAPGWLVEGSIL